nr:YfhO family protein [Clostridiales bacterium]
YHFPSANFGMKADVYVNGKYLVEYFTNETNCILELGTFTKGESVSVELKFKSTNIYISKASKYYFYYIDYGALNNAFSYLESSELFIEDYGNDFIKGNIYLNKGQELIFTTIPYDKGWNAYIDGVKVETVEVMDSLLAIPSTEGYHMVELRYMPTGTLITMIVSIISIAVFALFVVFTLNKKAAKWLTTKVFKKEYEEEDKKVLDLSPIGEYEDVFGESEYKSKLFPDEEESESKEEKKKDVLEEDDTSENKEETKEE